MSPRRSATIFTRPPPASCRISWHRRDMLGAQFPKGQSDAVGAKEDLTASRGLPASTGRDSVDEPLERVNREIKRRIDVVQVFQRRRAGPAGHRVLFEMTTNGSPSPAYRSRRQPWRDLPRKPRRVPTSEHAAQLIPNTQRGRHPRRVTPALRTRTRRGHAPHPGRPRPCPPRRVNVLWALYATGGATRPSAQVGQPVGRSSDI